MRMVRLTLVCTLLLVAAVPSYAIVCRSCDGPEYPYCINTPNSATRCEIGVDYCIDRPSAICIDGFQPSEMHAEWTVASIEVTRPAEDTKVVTTSPTAVAEATK